jgi:hypothetical protein
MTIENVAEELCEEKSHIIPPEDPDDRKVKKAKAEFYRAFEKALEPLFKALETVAEKSGHENGKSSQADFYKNLQGCVEILGNIKLAEISRFLEVIAKNHGDIKAKIEKAVSSQTLSMKPNKTNNKVTGKNKRPANKKTP